MGDHRNGARGKDFGLNRDINPRKELPPREVERLKFGPRWEHISPIIARGGLKLNGAVARSVRRHHRRELLPKPTPEDLRDQVICRDIRRVRKVQSKRYGSESGEHLHDIRREEDALLRLDLEEHVAPGDWDLEDEHDMVPDRRSRNNLAAGGASNTILRPQNAP